MSVQLLDKTRKINKLLHNNNSSKVVFNDICEVLTEILDSNILVISKKGKVLGSSQCRGIDEIHELIVDEVGGFIDSMLNERLLGILSTKENVNLETLGFESDIKKYYLEALEKLLSNKDSYITECQERLENEDVLVQLKETRQQAEISLEDLMAEIQGLVHENARKSQDQQKYRAKFNKFVQQIDEQKKRMAVLKAEELKLVGMREKLHRFIETLKNCKDATVFKEQEWNNLVERAVVKTESLDFEFKNGERIKITI